MFGTSIVTMGPISLFMYKSMASIYNIFPMLLAIVVRSCLLKRRSSISRNCTLRVYENVSSTFGALALNWGFHLEN
jgi:hypothetical protein